ncbi:hypothetical protein ROZALSC1DRAFT_23201 [Rozella allomycis CSF55]|uniref:Uncharacterized protein n=1 Tax=Rozella allomycis (strain CSF55) TaxID=988480 RepID=A0A4P9YGX6_ROZAC|nr:hypothetical protein ROZALSC1DRAFT_24503 [Rozella allomycis CSF55]RKP18478.1 hypothetical protein ROZALSC1DRAFT_23201 [Rozella allomycis CSF55]
MPTVFEMKGKYFGNLKPYLALRKLHGGMSFATLSIFTDYTLNRIEEYADYVPVAAIMALENNTNVIFSFSFGYVPRRGGNYDKNIFAYIGVTGMHWLTLMPLPPFQLCMTKMLIKCNQKTFYNFYVFSKNILLSLAKFPKIILRCTPLSSKYNYIKAFIFVFTFRSFLRI